MSRQRQIDPNAFLSPQKPVSAFSADLDELRRIITYIPVTGELRWNVRVPGAVDVGDVAGAVSPYGYTVIRINKKLFFAHRLAWLLTHGQWPTGQIDHRNGDRRDNRIDNLREVTQTVNSQNTRRARSDNSCGLLGVVWRPKHQRYAAYIVAGGKQRFLGHHDQAEDAHAAYVAAKRRLHEGCTL